MVRLKPPELPSGVRSVTKDPWGRTVLLTDQAMSHIADEHGEMDGAELLIETAIEQAECRTRGMANGKPVPNREVLWARNLGPSGRWFRVVVRYKQHKGVVITAYAGKKDPEVSERI